MPWTKPENSRNQINKAGDVLSARVALSDMSQDDALDIASNWRSSHGYPLHVMYQCLRKVAANVDERALVSKRQKRMPSIVVKLKRFDSMQLSGMQDLGGCRAVLQTIPKTDALVALYEGSEFDAFELDARKKKDYITSPKDDGYRSVHLIYKYRGRSQNGAFKGLRIEVQIRSRLQHAWATALETIDAFTGQGLKSNVGEEPWKRFFLLASAFMSEIEKRPVVAGISIGPELVAEFCALCERLNVPNIFEGLSVGVERSIKNSEGMEAHILQLDSLERRTRTLSFRSNKEAEKKFLELEKENADKPHIQTVMASSSSIQALKRAYPSYYADTGNFVRFIGRLQSKHKEASK